MTMLHIEFQPGQQATATARYQALNVFGSPDKIISEAGGPLPGLPLGFTWQYLPPLRHNPGALNYSIRSGLRGP